MSELDDKQEIKELVLRYGTAIDRCDYEMLCSVYATDGIDDNGGEPLNGAAYARKVLDMLTAEFDSTSHMIVNTKVKFVDGVGYGQTYYLAWHQLTRPDGGYDMTISGRYIDRFVKEDGQWKIGYRYRISDFNRIDKRHEKRPSSGPKREHGRRSKDDLMYRAFGVDIWS
jgi:ketosteroid isomerase-like protein